MLPDAVQAVLVLPFSLRARALTILVRVRGEAYAVNSQEATPAQTCNIFKDRSKVLDNKDSNLMVFLPT